MAASPTILSTTVDVIKALGGISPVAKMTKRKYSAACNWARWPHFPPNTYCVMKDALEERGFGVPPRSLWRMVE